MLQFNIRMSDPVPPGPALLLAPRLVDAVGFRHVDLEVIDGEIVSEIKATNGGQGAYIIQPTAAPRRRPPPPRWPRRS